MNGKVNIRELLINVVRTDKPKMLKGLSQKARGQAQEVPPSSVADGVPPAERQNLTHLMVHMRNVVSP